MKTATKTGVGTVHVLQFGELTTGQPYHDGGSWFRRDSYYSYVTKETVSERYFVAGPEDASGPHNRNDDYDPKCPCCWLGFAHSEECHQQKTA